MSKGPSLPPGPSPILDHTGSPCIFHPDSFICGSTPVSILFLPLLHSSSIRLTFILYLFLPIYIDLTHPLPTLPAEWGKKPTFVAMV